MEKDIVQLFRKRKIITIKQLSDILNRSEITARRKLKSWDALTSINANSKYYVLPDVPDFDAKGLWIFRSICFSRHGNLKQTIVHLIRQSESGISAQALLQTVGLPGSSSILSQAVRHPGIQRLRHHRAFVYFSDDPLVYDQQRESRERIQAAKHQMPSDAKAVAILIQLIRQPDITVAELARKVGRHGVDVSVPTIRMFLEKHDLSDYTQMEIDCAVKKTSDIDL